VGNNKSYRKAGSPLIIVAVSVLLGLLMVLTVMAAEENSQKSGKNEGPSLER